MISVVFRCHADEDNGVLNLTLHLIRVLSSDDVSDEIDPFDACIHSHLKQVETSVPGLAMTPSLISCRRFLHMAWSSSSPFGRESVLQERRVVTPGAP